MNAKAATLVKAEAHTPGRPNQHFQPTAYRARPRGRFRQLGGG